MGGLDSGRAFVKGIDGDPEGGDSGRRTEDINVALAGIERGAFGDVGVGAIGLASPSSVEVEVEAL